MARILEGDFLEMKEKKKKARLISQSSCKLFTITFSGNNNNNKKNLWVWNFVVMHTAIEHEVDVC